MKPAATIYLITNLVNGNQYVGLTRFDTEKRWREHRYNAASKRFRTYLYSAMRKYGAENFSIMPIASCLFLELASEVEQIAIQHFRPKYNQTNGGEFTVGKRPREVVERIRSKNLGLRRTAEQNKANSEQAKARYARDPAKRNAAIERLHQARPLIDQEKRKARAAEACRNRIWTEQSRAKLSASCTGRKYGPEIIARIAEKHNKPIECVTLGVTFDSVSEAARHLRIGISTISKACLGKLKTASGLVFRFA